MLTVVQCKTVVCSADAKRVRLSDADGLHLELTPNSKKRWFWKYRIIGTE